MRTIPNSKTILQLSIILITVDRTSIFQVAGLSAPRVNIAYHTATSPSQRQARCQRVQTKMSLNPPNLQRGGFSRSDVRYQASLTAKYVPTGAVRWHGTPALYADLVSDLVTMVGYLGAGVQDPAADSILAQELPGVLD